MGSRSSKPRVFKVADLSASTKARSAATLGREPSPSQQTLAFEVTNAESASDYSFVVWGNPMGKPRMTRQDKWKKRPCVMRYRQIKDEIKAACKADLTKRDVWRLDWIAYMEMAKSWSKKKRAFFAGGRHRAKPDKDNIDKGILDALFTEDSTICEGFHSKRWDDGHGPRLEVTLYFMEASE